MSCPLFRRAQLPQCRAVAGGPVPVGREIVASYCRGRYGDCPAYRYVRAAGHPLNPADFRAWVVDGMSPGRVDPYPASPGNGADTP